jgi:hypothetical protein
MDLPCNLSVGEGEELPDKAYLKRIPVAKKPFIRVCSGTVSEEDTSLTASGSGTTAIDFSDRNPFCPKLAIFPTKAWCPS